MPLQASMTVSTASSPTFWAILFTPDWKRLVVYDFSGISSWRRQMKSCSSLRNITSSVSFFSPQQVSVPVWQTGPSGRAFTNSVSWSQSAATATTCRKFPLVSPFVHRQLRLRLKKVTLPLLKVCSKASSFMKPNINTLFVLLSCTMAGINPPIFSKSNVIVCMLYVYNLTLMPS